MPQFIVHQHHHYGWTTNPREAESERDAAYADVLAYHKFLTPENHTWTFDGMWLFVRETQVRRIFGGYTTPGDSWFSSKIRIGQPDDCPKCAGTGMNHYNPFVECWACGDGKTTGKSSGKRKPKEPAHD